MSITIDLLRHGETGQRSYRGRNDDALTDAGWAQLRAVTRDHQWDVIISSTLQRCAAFATELAQAHAVPLHLDPRLMEYDFGAWQGVPIAALAEQQGEALGRFWADPAAHPPPGAEPFDAFRTRLCAAMDQAALKAASQRVLVVTHGGAIRLLRCLAESRPFGHMANIDVPHAALHALAWPPRPEAV